jgi:hypothetical protein
VNDPTIVPARIRKSREPPHPHAVKTSVIGFSVLFLLVALNWAAVHFGWVQVPPNMLPWQPARLDSRPGLFAHLQVQNLLHDRQACLTALNHAHELSYTPLADEVKGDSCGFTNVVSNTHTPIAFNTTPVTTCALSAALYWWQRDLQTIATQQLHSPIVRIDQMGTYACRNVNSEATGPRSEHATANAIDIAGFETADGRRIIVAQDWLKPTPEGRFLRAAHDSACGMFSEVLGPDYNTLHANHFHLDEANWLICR